MTIPELRFKADDGSEFPDWEGKKLGDNVKFINGRAYSQDELLSVGKYQVLRVGNLFTNDTYYYSDMELEPDKYIEDGDLIYAWSATFGPRIYIGNKCIYHYHIWKLKFDENIVSKTFLNYILERDVEKIMSQRTGGTMVHITKSAMENRELFFPSLPEQKKIASFLSMIDDIITTTEAELTAWQERKKGVMQKIFNREVRFKADDGSEFPEWEEKRLGEVGQFYTGVGFSDRFQGYKELPIDVYKVSDMNINGNEKYMKTANNTVDDNILRDMKTKSVNDSCLVFAKVGAAIYGERKRITLKPFVIDNNMMAFMPDVQLLQMEYLYTWSCSVRFSKYAQVGALPSYNSSDIGCIKIPIPSLPEQKKIAECLSSLDDVINQIDAELSAWKEFKKGLLQQMFV